MKYDPETVARILCRAYNEWTNTHGPDTDGARAEGGQLVIVHDGTEYDITITHGGDDLPAGYRTIVHRSCGLPDCTDPAHLFLVDAVI